MIRYALLGMAAVLLLSAATLPGAFIGRRRARQAAQAVRTARAVLSAPVSRRRRPQPPELPLDAGEREDVLSWDRTEAAILDAWRDVDQRFSEIIRQLAPEFDISVVRAAPSVDVALERLREGVREPGGMWDGSLLAATGSFALVPRPAGAR